MTKKALAPVPSGNDREKGTREDGEAMPPAAADPALDRRPDAATRKGAGIPLPPEPDVEGVGKETGPSAGKIGLKGEKG